MVVRRTQEPLQIVVVQAVVEEVVKLVQQVLLDKETTEEAVCLEATLVVAEQGQLAVMVQEAK